jgi:hypothetical protein
MNKPTRVILAVIGLFLIILSLIALAYVLTPVQVIHDQAPLGSAALILTPGSML